MADRPPSATAQAATYWNKHLHDLAVARHPIGTRGFFEDLREYHFDKQRHLSKVVDYASYAGKDLLDLGCGVGIDAVRFAQDGARITGVDISERAIGLARTNFEQHGLTADLHVMDAEHLEFADESFDVVYAHGILPYSKDFYAIVREIHRVLRPGGEAILQTYHKPSWMYLLWKTVKVGLEHQRAPFFHIHTMDEMEKMVRPFSRSTITTERFPVRTRLHTGAKGALYNLVFVGAFNAVPRRLVRRFGWHIVAKAVK
jgi:2-polyprenyl-3-methyl-5-hydroxy-6-metoxy-1,4-benzoquinol methylase